MPTQVSVVLGTYNRCNFLQLTIKNIREELQRLALPAEIIVVDGSSTDKTLQWLMHQKDIISIVQHNRGIWQNKPIKKRSWGYFMNLAFKCAQGKYICMVSDDCLMVPNALVNGYKLFESKLNNKENIGALAFYWRNLPLLQKNWNTNKTYHVLTMFDKPFVNHGMYLKEALEEVNYIDETTYQFYNADTDLCLRLDQKGYACCDAPNSYVEHYHYANVKVKSKNESTTDVEQFYKKWNPIFKWPSNKNPASAKHKKYDDLYKTAERFATIHTVSIKTIENLSQKHVSKKINQSINFAKKCVLKTIKFWGNNK